MEEEKKEQKKTEEEEKKETEETPGVAQAKETMGMVQGILGKIGSLIGGIFGGGKRSPEERSDEGKKE